MVIRIKSTAKILEKWNSILFTVIVITAIISSCKNSQKKYNPDGFMAGLVLGDSNWRDREYVDLTSKPLKIGNHSVRLQVFDWDIQTKMAIDPADSVSTTISLNDDTLKEGYLRNIKVDIHEQIGYKGSIIYNELENLYGKPNSTNYITGSKLFEVETDHSQKDTIGYIYNWVTSKMSIEYFYSVVPIKETGSKFLRNPYISYRVSNFENEYKKAKMLASKERLVDDLILMNKINCLETNKRISVFTTSVKNIDLDSTRKVNAFEGNLVFKENDYSSNSYSIENLKISLPHPLSPSEAFKGSTKSPIIILSIPDKSKLRDDAKNGIGCKVIDFKITKVYFSDGSTKD